MAALWVSEDRVVPICRMGMPQWMSASALAPGLEPGTAGQVTLRQMLGTNHCSDGFLGVSPGLSVRGPDAAQCPFLTLGWLRLAATVFRVGNNSPCFISLSDSLVGPGLLAKT